MMNETSTSSVVPRDSLGDSVAQDFYPGNIEGRIQDQNQHDSYLEKQTAVLPMPSASRQVVLGTSETSYIGATHWAAILEDVRESSP